MNATQSPDGHRCQYVDAEWMYEPGREGVDLAMVPLCAAVVNSNGSEFSFTDRDRFQQYVHDHWNDTWIAWGMQAEVSAMIAWGIEPPPNWIDLMVCYRWETNKIRLFDANGEKLPPTPSGLYDALDHYGLPVQEVEHKKSMQQLALRGPQTPDEWRALQEYNMDDARALRKLHPHIPVPPPSRLWSHFLRVVPAIQREATPIDLEHWDKIFAPENQVAEGLMEAVNAVFPVYEKGHFREARFAALIEHLGLADLWPRTETGKFQRGHDLLRDMEIRFPFIGQLRQCQDTIRNFSERKLILDRKTAKHFHNIWPFSSTTGRNQPTVWLPGCMKWMRLLVKPYPGHAIIYVDFTAQEFALAAAISGDREMIRCYELPGDPYVNFGVLAGLCPPGTPKSAPIRDVLKVVFLAQLYGQGAYGVALRLGVSVREAERLIKAHERLFPRFHEWRQNWIDHAILRGQMFSRLGWRVLVPEPRVTTLMNFPVQAGGAEILRLATIELVRSGFIPCDLIHDAVLLHVPLELEKAAIEAVDAAFTFANRIYAPEVRMRWKAEQFEERWIEKKGLEDWNRILKALERKSA